MIPFYYLFINPSDSTCLIGDALDLVKPQIWFWKRFEYVGENIETHLIEEIANSQYIINWNIVIYTGSMTGWEEKSIPPRHRLQSIKWETHTQTREREREEKVQRMIFDTCFFPFTFVSIWVALLEFQTVFSHLFEYVVNVCFKYLVLISDLPALLKKISYAQW